LGATVAAFPLCNGILDEPPSLVGFFNQIKQEYVSARWSLYGGTHSSSRAHFSDRDVTLTNTLALLQRRSQKMGGRG
jgi:hypothetical protein